MIEEIWKEYGNYKISNYGNVIGKRGKLLKGYIQKNGYKYVHINGKEVRIHRLIGKIFIPNPNNLPQINHKNGIKNDNRVENLEWCNNSYNNKHKYIVNKIEMSLAHKLKIKENIKKANERTKKKIGMYKAGILVKKYNSKSEAAKELKISRNTINYSCKNICETNNGIMFLEI